MQKPVSKVTLAELHPPRQFGAMMFVIVPIPYSCIGR
jgi:hypothetical protein